MLWALMTLISEERKRRMERGERGGTDREREGGSERERKRGGKYRGKLHGHTRTFTDNWTCMLLVPLWTRIKELVPVQQTS